jgi:hypothetical protein
MRATLNRAHDLTPAGLSAAAAGLGKQPGDNVWSWRLTPTRHDGADAVRLVTYSGGTKGQWRYITPLTPTG